MFKSLSLLLLTCFLFSQVLSDTIPYVEYKYEDSIIILDPASINQALNEFSYTFIEFYAPWCHHCKKVVPEYIQAAHYLSETNPEIKLCKADFSDQKDLISQYNISGFPTFRLYIKGQEEPVDCRGCRTSQEIIRWLRKHTGSPSLEMNSLEDFEKFITNNPNVAAYFGSKKAESFKAFNMSASEIEDVSFISTDIEETRRKYGVEEGQVVLFVSYGTEKRLLREGFDKEKLNSFIENRKYPLVSQYERSLNQRIFQNKLDTIFLFKKDNKAGTKALKRFKEVANEYGDKIVFSFVNYEENPGAKLARSMNVTEDDLPTLRIMQIKLPLNKFYFHKKVTQENIRGFIQDFWDRRIDPYFKSQDLPAEKYINNVRVLVGKNFKEVVFDESQDVMVFFFAPTCYYSGLLKPVIEKVALRVKETPNLVIACMDTTGNEAEDSKATATPSVKFYPRGKKYEPIDYNSAHIEEAFMGWLSRYATVEIVDSDRFHPNVNHHHQQHQNIDL